MRSDSNESWRDSAAGCGTCALWVCAFFGFFDVVRYVGQMVRGGKSSYTQSATAEDGTECLLRFTDDGLSHEVVIEKGNGRQVFRWEDEPEPPEDPR